jgi:sigma-E factor negative regulatory protein RseC
VIEEQAVVIAINGKQVVVESEVKSSCHGCQQSENCASGQVARALPKRKLVTEIHSELHLNPGDKVIIGLEEKPLLTSAAQVYLLPLAGLLLGAVGGQFMLQQGLFNSELPTIILSFFSAYAGFRLARYLQKRQGKEQQKFPGCQPIIVRRLDQRKQLNSSENK